MADRIVLLGWNGEAIELKYPGDAAAFVDTGMCRVSLTLWSGPLADATILQIETGWLLKNGGENEVGYAAAIAAVEALVRPEERDRFILDVPIPVRERPHPIGGTSRPKCARCGKDTARAATTAGKGHYTCTNPECPDSFKRYYIRPSKEKPDDRS